MNRRLASVLTTCALFSVKGVTELTAWCTHSPQVLLWLVPVVLAVQAVPQYCSHPVLVHPVSKALHVENTYTKRYISHRFFQKNQIHTISPEVLGHPSPLLDPAGDKKNEHKWFKRGNCEICSPLLHKKHSSELHVQNDQSQLSQNTHGANWFQLRSSEDLMFKSISQNFWQSSQTTRSKWTKNISLAGN